MLPLLLHTANVWLNCWKKMMSTLSTIWGNTDGFAEQYKCASALYHMSFLCQSHSIIINRGTSAPGNGKGWLMVLMPLTSAICINECLMFNFQDQEDLRQRFYCILEHWKKMSVWIKNSKNICLRLIVNMESLIRENTGKDPVKENGQTDNIMLMIMLTLHTSLWKRMVIQTNSQHYHFVVHIQSLM